MKYLKEDNTLNIPEEFEQVFFKDPALVTDQTQVLLLKQKGIIDGKDIKILEYIYEMKFPTQNQMERLAEYMGIEMDDFFARLSIMFSNGLINKFSFVDEERYRGKLPEDTKVFYCLHTGGETLLNSFVEEGFVDWVPGYNITSAKSVAKTVIASELFLQLLLGDVPLVSHSRRPRYTIKERIFTGGDEFCLKGEDIPHYFISEIFFASDKQNIVRQKLSNYEGLFSTKGWMRYYKDGEKVPVLIFVTEDDETASSLAGLIAEFYRFTGKYLFTTKERVLLGVNEEGGFLYHDKDENRLRKTCLREYM